MKLVINPQDIINALATKNGLGQDIINAFAARTGLQPHEVVIHPDVFDGQESEGNFNHTPTRTSMNTLFEEGFIAGAHGRGYVNMIGLIKAVRTLSQASYQDGKEYVEKVLLAYD